MSDEENTATAAPPRTLAAMINFSDWPPAKMVSALCYEFVHLPIGQRILCFTHIMALLPLVLYPCMDEEISIEKLREQASVEDDHDGGWRKHGGDFASTMRGFFSAARRVNPCYTVLPFFFVTIVGSLNMVSELVLLRPKLLRAAWRHYYGSISRDFDDPRWVRDLSLDVRPLILTWSCLVPALGIFLMFINFCQSLIRPLLPAKPPSPVQFGLECLRLRQNVEPEQNPDAIEFYNSGWFTPVAMLPFLLGVPAAITLWIYGHCGVNVMLGHPESNPGFFNWIVVCQLYLGGLGCCLSALFFRSYFTFAWNFSSTEYELEVYPDMIKSLPIKGWFYDFLSSRGFNIPAQILWKDVTSITAETARLQTSKLELEHPGLVLLKKITSIYDNIASKLDIHTETLEIRSKARTISVRLWELSSEQKVQLFHSIRKNAPWIFLDKSVQQALIGSTVLQEAKYTQIWFEVLSGGSISRSGELERGDKLRDGKYCVRSKVASGGQAVVYQAIDDDGAAVVLKEFHLTPGESLEVMIESAKDFENESSVLGQLSHRGIVKLYDMFFEEGRIYLVLEHVKGKSLREMVTENGPLSLKQISHIAKQMCDVLKYLHTQEPPVVHRDFTPDNIILQPNGQIKLIDFSVSQRKEKGQSADCAGKHAYTPPEQFRGMACPQSDIYAMGATLYYMATGNDPDPISISELPDDIDGQLDLLRTTIRTATQLSLESRYDSTDWLLADIAAIEAKSSPAILKADKVSAPLAVLDGTSAIDENENLVVISDSTPDALLSQSEDILEEVNSLPLAIEEPELVPVLKLAKKTVQKRTRRARARS